MHEYKIIYAIKAAIVCFFFQSGHHRQYTVYHITHVDDFMYCELLGLYYQFLWIQVLLLHRAMFLYKDHLSHDDVIKCKHFPRYWPFVRGIHRSAVNSPHKGQWRGALMFSLICVWINGWVNNRGAGDLRHHRANCDVIVMKDWTVVRPTTGQGYEYTHAKLIMATHASSSNCDKTSTAEG